MSKQRRMKKGMTVNVEKKLTPRQRLFVAEYLKDFHATKAAIRAKFSKKTAYSIGSELLKKPEIIVALSQSRKSLDKREEKALMEAHEVEAHLDRLIRQNPQEFYQEDGVTLKNIHDLTPEQAYAIQELAHIETPLGSQVKIKFEGKRNAIDLKMKRLGLLKGDEEKGDTNIQINLINFRREDLA